MINYKDKYLKYKKKYLMIGGTNYLFDILTLSSHKLIENLKMNGDQTIEELYIKIETELKYNNRPFALVYNINNLEWSTTLTVANVFKDPSSSITYQLTIIIGELLPVIKIEGDQEVNIDTIINYINDTKIKKPEHNRILLKYIDDIGFGFTGFSHVSVDMMYKNYYKHFNILKRITNPDFILYFLRYSDKYHLFKLIDYAEELYSNDDILTLIIEKTYTTLKDLPDTLKNDLIICKFLKVRGLNLQDIPHDEQKPEYVETAINQNSLALRFAAPYFKSDLKYVKLAINQNGYAFKYIDPKFKTDRELIKLALSTARKTDGEMKNLLEYISIDNIDIDLIEEYIKQYGCKNIDMCVSINDPAIFKMIIELCPCPEVIKSLYRKPDLLIAALSMNGLLLKYVDSTKYQTLDIVMAAVKQNGNALDYVLGRFKTDPKVIEAARTHEI